MKYDVIRIYHKRTNLLDYLAANQHQLVGCYATSEEYNKRMNNLIRQYSQERDVRLILSVRYEREPLKDKRTLCKIRCPINPLPVKGEFEVPTLNTLENFLRKDGWVKTEQVHKGMLE